jgi:hypothetical protein
MAALELCIVKLLAKHITVLMKPKPQKSMRA